MPNINIDDAYILNETGAQVDKVTGLYFKDESTSAAEKAFAQLNIGTAGSNRNLLDNPWFTVRQRGNGPFVAQYSADRWYAAGGGLQVTLGDGGATLAFSATYREFRQTIVNPTYYANGTYTMSVKVTGYTSSGSIRMQVHDGANASVASFTFNSPGIHHYTFTTGANGIGKLGLYNIGNTYATMTVEAIKLERGPVSTLANDTPPDYGEELLKCQRYFTRWYSTAGSSAIGLALAVGATNANFALLSNLRAEGSATVSFTGLVLSDGTDKTVTNVSVAGAGDGKSMRLLVTSSGLTAYRPYVLQITAGGHLDVSKDL